MEFDLLDQILVYLNDVREYSVFENIGKHFYGDGITKMQKSNLNSALLKLLKDEFVLEDSFDEIRQNDLGEKRKYDVYAYSISFEGIIFIQQGGYRAQMDRNQRLQNERLNLEYENQLLRMEQRHLSRVTVRLTWVVAIAAVLPSIYAFFQILEYFGYFRTNAIKILYCPFFC